jgi:hypothetical protein
MNFTPDTYIEPPRDQVTNMGLYLMGSVSKPSFDAIEVLAGSKPLMPAIPGSLAIRSSWESLLSSQPTHGVDLITDIHRGSHHHRQIGEAILFMPDYERMMHRWFTRLDQASEFLNPNGVLVQSVAVALGQGGILESVQRRDDALLRADGQVIVPITNETIQQIEDQTKLRVIALEPGTTPQTVLASVTYAIEGRARRLLAHFSRPEEMITPFISWQNEQVLRYGTTTPNGSRTGTRYIAHPHGEFTVDQIPRPNVTAFGLSGQPNRWIIGLQRK